MAGTLTYLLLFLPALASGGVGLRTWILFAVLMLLPLLAAHLVSGLRLEGSTYRATSGIVAMGLVAALLSAAGQTLSLLGRVNPIVATITIAVTSTVIAVAAGTSGAARVGRWLSWTVVVLVAATVAAGAYLGRPADLTDPVVTAQALPPTASVLLAMSMFVLGATDPSLRAYLHGASNRVVARTMGGLFTLLLLLGLGLLLVFGGVFVAPSLAFFLVPANLGVTPILLVVAMAIAAFWFCFAVTSLLSGAAGEPTGESGNANSRLAWAGGVGLLALGIALLPISTEWVLFGTALVATAGITAQVVTAGRVAPGEHAGARWGMGCGLAVALGSVAIMATTGVQDLGVVGLLAMLATGGASALAAMLASGKRRTP